MPRWDQRGNNMTGATKKILKQVVTFINKHKDGSELYNILTALRGPDSEDYSLKSCTTAVLRRAIGLPGEGASIGYDSYEDTQEFVEQRKHHRAVEDETKEGHFLQHVRLGFASAGLKLNAVNRPARKKTAKKAKR